MKIVVTGAIGHIGSYVVRDLGTQFTNAEITMIDNMMTQRYPSLFNLPTKGNYHFIEGDVNSIDLKSVFSEDPNKDYFTRENLSKILLKHGKENLLDILDFKILITKKNKNTLIDLKKYFLEFEIPVMPIKARDLIKKFDLKEGKLLGSILRDIEEHWLNNNFKISNNEIENIVKSKRI